MRTPAITELKEGGKGAVEFRISPGSKRKGERKGQNFLISTSRGGELTRWNLLAHHGGGRGDALLW